MARRFTRPEIIASSFMEMFRALEDSPNPSDYENGDYYDDPVYKKEIDIASSLSIRAIGMALNKSYPPAQAACLGHITRTALNSTGYSEKVIIYIEKFFKSTFSRENFGFNYEFDRMFSDDEYYHGYKSPIAYGKSMFSPMKIISIANFVSQSLQNSNVDDEIFENVTKCFETDLSTYQAEIELQNGPDNEHMQYWRNMFSNQQISIQDIVEGSGDQEETGKFQKVS